ncbi:hypothetical protein BH23CHL8_BH23CHL8_24120 [soil metagenome]
MARDQVQAVGTAQGADGERSPSSLWTWALGEPSGEPETLAEDGDAFIDAPVPFQGGYLATGTDMGTNRNLTVWRLEAAAG